MMTNLHSGRYDISVILMILSSVGFIVKDNVGDHGNHYVMLVVCYM